MKMDKPRDFEYNLIKEGNAHEVQSRGINASNEDLKIRADASELKKKRGGENRACQGGANVGVLGQDKIWGS